MPESLKNVSLGQMDQVQVMVSQEQQTMEEPLINFSAYNSLDSEANQDGKFFKQFFNWFSEILRCLGCL